MAYKDKEKKKQYNKQRYQDNKEHKKQQSKQWSKDNPEYGKQWYQDNKEHKKQQSKQWYQDNKEHRKQWYQDNKEHCTQRSKQWRKDNKEHCTQRSKQWRKDNPEHSKQWHKDNPEYNKQYMKTRYQTDPIFKLNQTMRLVIWRSLKTNTLSKNGIHWEDLVGYNLGDLKSHLEQQFDLNMNWDNHGSYWHIDHIIPLSSLTFDSVEHDNFKLLWGLGNLQPLFDSENRSKHNKILINFYSLLFPFTEQPGKKKIFKDREVGINLYNFITFTYQSDSTSYQYMVGWFHRMRKINREEL